MQGGRGFGELAVCSCSAVWGLGFGVWGLGFGGLGFRGLGLKGLLGVGFDQKVQYQCRQVSAKLRGVFGVQKSPGLRDDARC